MKGLLLALCIMLAATKAADARIDCEVGSTAMLAHLLGSSCRSPSNGNAQGFRPVPTPEIRRIVDRIARRTGLEARLMIAVIAAESAFDPRAVSPRNAQGLMQLLPETAARFGVRHPFDAAENIRGGAAYLRSLLNEFDGNLDLALAAYNAGEGAVLAYGTVPPYDETIQYIDRVKRFYALDRRQP